MQREAYPPHTSKRKALILVGVGIGALLILVALFSRGRIDLSQGDMRAIQGRFRQLERRIDRLEDTKERIIFLQKQERAIKQRIAGHNGGGPLTEQLEALNERVEHLEKTLAAGSSRTVAQSQDTREPLAVPGGRYHVVQSGDTLYVIAQRYGISVEQLCRLNNMTLNQVIYPGERLMVAPAASQ
jgi:uncharacterized protein (UPF0335 family)